MMQDQSPAQKASPLASNGSNGSMSGESVGTCSNLTNSQFLIWTGQRLHGDVPLYNMVLSFQIQASVDPNHFQAAFQALLDRCDVLRTVIEETDGAPRQRVRPSFAHLVEMVDLTSSSNPQTAFRAWMRERVVRHLDLSRCLFDTALLRLAPDRYAWYLNQHHLITDGWSTALVYRHMAELYGRSVAGTLDQAPALPNFGDYVDYERSLRQSALARKVAAYWAEKTAARFEPIKLYGKNASGGSGRTVRYTCDIDLECARRLRSMAAEKDVRALTPHLTLFTIFATVLFAYLHRVSGRRRLSIGAPSHNRPTATFKETAGLFIEIFPIQIEVGDGETFLSLLEKVRRETNALMRYAQPGTSTPDMNRSFNVLLNYINAAFGPFAGRPMTSEWVHAGHGDSHHHLRLQVHDFDDAGSFRLHFDFDSELIDESERDQAAGHFLRLLDGFLADRFRAIDSVDVLSGDERRRMLVEFNLGRTAYPTAESVVGLFEAQVRSTPEARAVLCGGCELTYAELDERANRLALHLRARGIGCESIVPLYLSRSSEMLMGVLGVLKAGAAFAPIDPHHPAERVMHVLRETQAAVVLTLSTMASEVPAFDGKVICLDTDEIDQSASAPPGRPPQAGDLAYVLYTSGSTGMPKGVMVTHGALAHYISWARSFYLHGQPHDFPLFTALTFDLTLTSVFVPLVTGGTVVVYREEQSLTDLALLRVIEDNLVDVIKLTPSHLALLHGRDLSASRARILIVGGEELRTDVARAAHRAFGGGAAIYNEYGPTEATVGCIVHRYDPSSDVGTSVPIGVPATVARIYVLNDQLQPVPAGVEGEIYISGDILARGYFGPRDLTAGSFLENPFEPVGRMYRTGDRGSWNADGLLHYHGRAGDQLKVRGFRIERGEIESVLADHPDAGACVVDVVDASAPESEGDVFHCARCGLPSTYPGISYDANGVCNVCRSFDAYRANVRAYFRSMDDLRAIFAERKRAGEYDCLMLLSGGKDSTYALYQLVGMGLKVFAFTLDNGYISEEAKGNIRRVTDDLGVDHVFGTTPAMNAIFVDSLERHSNVCNGCFKTVYTLAIKHAREKRIPFIVTGLSRGQFFETRLTEELFLDGRVDAGRIDHIVLEARKAYHRADDAVNRLLDAAPLVSDELFDEVQFIDFYRYCDVTLDEMVEFLNRHAPWIRPTDTGRSTNCLINQVGIYMHRKERGYHNYALPYSWDVRLGHKLREAALIELDDEIDRESVEGILHEIGYAKEDRSTNQYLTAFYTGRASSAELRTHLSRKLPDYMIPDRFVRLDALPLSPNGKLDRAKLPRPESRRPDLEAAFVPPRTAVEQGIAAVWAGALKVREVGVNDEFIALGGTSLLAIQIISRLNQIFQIDLPLRSAFEASTVTRMAVLIEDTLRREIESLSEDEAQRLVARNSGVASAG